MRKRKTKNNRKSKAHQHKQMSKAKKKKRKKGGGEERKDYYPNCLIYPPTHGNGVLSNFFVNMGACVSL